MILDEATANIDTETELLIQDSLEKMRNIGTMLIVAHRLSTIQHADNIIVLSKGKILEQGNHDDNQEGGTYHRMSQEAANSGGIFPALLIFSEEKLGEEETAQTGSGVQRSQGKYGNGQG